MIKELIAHQVMSKATDKPGWDLWHSNVGIFSVANSCVLFFSICKLKFQAVAHILKMFNFKSQASLSSKLTLKSYGPAECGRGYKFFSLIDFPSCFPPVSTVLMELLLIRKLALSRAVALFTDLFQKRKNFLFLTLDFSCFSDVQC